MVYYNPHITDPKEPGRFFRCLNPLLNPLRWVDRDAKIVLINFVLKASGVNPSKNFMIINYHACEIPEKNT